MATFKGSVTIKLLAGREYIVPYSGPAGWVSFILQEDGTIKPDGVNVPAYEILSYEWNGAAYETVRKKGGGALVGMGGKRGLLGSMLGAAGHTGKTRTFNKEIKSNAYLSLRNIKTDELFTILFECDSAIDVTIRNMLIKAGKI